MLSSDKVTIKKRIYNFSVGKMQGDAFALLFHDKTVGCNDSFILFLP